MWKYYLGFILISLVSYDFLNTAYKHNGILDVVLALGIVVVQFFYVINYFRNDLNLVRRGFVFLTLAIYFYLAFTGFYSPLGGLLYSILSLLLYTLLLVFPLFVFLKNK